MFVLIIGEEQLGIFDRSEDAYGHGIESRGNVPVLIKGLFGLTDSGTPEATFCTLQAR